MPVQTITETITSLTLGVGGVVGTNLENVVVAVAVFCGRVPVAVLGAGFFFGLAALLALSWLTAMAIGLLPIEYLGIFGVLPIVLGLRELLRGGEGQHDAPRTVSRGAVLQSVTVVGLLMIVNGVDTVAVFAPLIAESEFIDRLVISGGFLLASLLMVWVCVHACIHPLLAKPIDRYGNRVAPMVMIGIGIYILLNTGTDSLP